MKLHEMEVRAAEAYRLALTSLHLPYGRDALESSASSHELRALRIHKELAASPQPKGASASQSSPVGAPPRPKPSSLLLQRAANLLGPHTALGALEKYERRLLRAYESVDISELPPALRLFLESELYPEQLRTLESITAGKDSYR